VNMAATQVAFKARASARIGRFELIDVLGRGAQAEVWRANDQRLDREVALKLLSPHAQGIAVHQWLHEARAVSRLSHPNIVPVFEADETDGQRYLVFELVRGKTLAEALRGSGARPERRGGVAAARRARGPARSACARCVVFALRDPKSGTLTGRFGLGDGVQALVSQFSVRLCDGRSPAQDLLAAVCHKGSDLLIADASAAQVAQRLPPWLRATAEARTFLLLPMTTKGATFALIYADRAQPGSIAASEKELSLLRTLRSQAVMAFRQAA